MKRSEFLSVFSVPKPIIGMVHLGLLAGQDGFRGEEEVIQAARRDIRAWQKGGIHGLILENWLEDAVTPFVPRKRRKSMQNVVTALTRDIRVPFGINVLNNDYPAAFEIARHTGASFIQMDAYVDPVVSDFTYNDAAAKDHPFTVEVHHTNVLRAARRRGLSSLPIIAGIHPKHYQLLDSEKTIEQSAVESKRRGLSGIVITKATGSAPLIEVFHRVRRVVDTPIGVGSGLTAENAGDLLAVCDFAIVGTYAKIDGVTENPVDERRVSRLLRVWNLASQGVPLRS